MTTGTVRDRWVLCDRCGAALRRELDVASSVGCSECGFEVVLSPRSSEPLGSRGPLDEAERLRRLREQDGRPLLPPAGLEQLLQAGELPAHKEREALELYLTDRRALRESADPAAQQRLMFLTLVLANHIDDPARRRALFETSLDAAPLQRHQQVLRGFLAREAARGNDLTAAEAWLAPCDPRSDDLEMDTSWRFSRATIALMRRDWDSVLEVLGPSPDAVPLADTTDAVALVYRAHAHERLGDIDRATSQLAKAMAAGNRRAIDEIIERWPEWDLCAASIGPARERNATAAAASARSMSGGGVGTVMLMVGLATATMGVGMAVAGVLMTTQQPSEDAVGLIIGGLITLVVGGPVVGLMGWRSVRTARRNARIRIEGLPATGTVVSAERTGVEINDVPMMALTLRIELDDRPPWEATTRLLVPPQNQSILQVGKKLYVRVDAKEPSRVVLDTG